MFNKRVREHFIYTKLCFLHQTRSKKAALKSLLYNFSNIKPFKYKKKTTTHPIGRFAKQAFPYKGVILSFLNFEALDLATRTILISDIKDELKHAIRDEWDP